MTVRPQLTARGLATRISLLGVSTLLAILLVAGFRTPDERVLQAAGSGTTTAGGSSAGSADSGSSGTAAGSSPATGSTAAGGSTFATAGTASQTVDGPVEGTRYGPVQVEVTISGGKIVAVTAVQLPSGGRSGSISNYVAPILASEALSAQNAAIDTVSGATYTSRAYTASLQAALDQAGA